MPAEASTWTAIGPWVNISSLAIDPRTPAIIYAGTDAGVFKSTSGGASWAAVNSGLDTDSDLMVWDLAIDPETPTTIYAGTDGGIFKSADGGETWRPTTRGLAEPYAPCVRIDPAAPRVLYAVTGFDGVIKSTDAGGSWNAANAGLTDDARPLVLEIDPVTTSTLYLGTYDGGVFKSTNSGRSWHAVNAGLGETDENPVDKLVVSPAEPTTVYALTRYRGIFKSTDGGTNWTPFNSGATYATLLLDPFTPATMYFGTSRGGLFKSTDAGEHWAVLNPDLDNTPVIVLAADPSTPNILYVGTYGGGVFTNQVSAAFAPVQMPTTTPAPFAPTEGGPMPATALARAPSPLPPAPAPSWSPGQEDWRAIMDGIAWHSVQDTPLAGVTMAVRRLGETDWVQAYGFADVDGSVPASADTVYKIGSLSMQFTAAAVMQLNERHAVDLGAPISRYLDDLPEELRSRTLHQLLSHTSRIYDSPFDVQDKFFSEQAFTSETLLQELVPNLRISSDDIPERFSYGNYILIGLVIEKVTGMSYAEYVKQYVIARAGLQHTRYCEPPPDGLARGYYAPGTAFEPLDVNVSAAFAAGGLCSTAGDMLTWMEALNTWKVVSPASYQKMTTPAQLADGTLGSFGYGLYTMRDSYGLQVGFMGGEASYVSYVVSYPDRGLTIVLLSNTAKPENNLLQTIWENVPVLME